MSRDGVCKRQSAHYRATRIRILSLNKSEFDHEFVQLLCGDHSYFAFDCTTNMKVSEVELKEEIDLSSREQAAMFHAIPKKSVGLGDPVFERVAFFIVLAPLFALVGNSRRG
jgi:hypothetical protein